jgi:hypothetical protein
MSVHEQPPGDSQPVGGQTTEGQRCISPTMPNMRCSARRRAVAVAIGAPRGRRRYWALI